MEESILKRIGVFLGFYPGDNLSIHGIGRLLAFLLKENEKVENRIVIFCPEWLIISLHELMKEHKISKNNFEIMTTIGIPLGVKLKNFLSNKRAKSKKISKIKSYIKKGFELVIETVKNMISNLFSTTSTSLLLLKMAMYLLLFLISVPFILTGSFLYLIYKLFRKLGGILLKVTCKLFASNLILTSLKKTLLHFKKNIYQYVLDNELNKLVAIVNKRKDIKACYIPSMAWQEIEKLKCKKILAAPDIVFYDFPTQFQGVGQIHKRIRNSIDAADHLICYSDYVKEQHLINQCGIEADKITVIKHANIDMMEHLKIPSSITNDITVEQNACQIINKYILNNYSPKDILYDSDIRELDYIIYSSQYRAHKNIFSLIKAMKIVNKEEYRNIKLIVTGDLSNVEYIREYIKKNYLEDDIIIMHNISSDMLAALNKLAKCAVNPTLFEGGFPFTFSEAYSVGTPSVMSEIPVVRTEIENENLRDIMLFNPNNPYSIAKKIIWAIDNNEYLYNQQKGLYQKFNQRNWSSVANEYNRVFNKLLLQGE